MLMVLKKGKLYVGKVEGKQRGALSVKVLIATG